MGCVLLPVPPSSSSHSARFDPFNFGNGSFCAPRKSLRDFGLSRLPALPEVPESGKPLGNHGAVSIYGGFTRVMPKPQGFGYGFSEHNYTGTVRLDWIVTAQLWAVDRTGAPLEEVDHDALFIGRLSAANQPNLYLEPPPNRGFYRFDIQFTDSAGTQIGSYGAYFKVVGAFWKPRLGLSRDSVHPGQRLLSRVENLGTETVFYGEQFSLHRAEGGSWVHVLIPGRRGWLMWLGVAGPGVSGRCSGLRLPHDFPPGRYRIVKEVGPSPWPKANRSYYLVAPFTVTPKGAAL